MRYWLTMVLVAVALVSCQTPVRSIVNLEEIPKAEGAPGALSVEAARADVEAYLDQTRIASLSLDEADPIAALKALHRAARDADAKHQGLAWRMVLRPGTKLPKANVRLHDVTVREALDYLCDGYGLIWQVGGLMVSIEEKR